MILSVTRDFAFWLCVALALLAYCSMAWSAHVKRKIAGLTFGLAWLTHALAVVWTLMAGRFGFGVAISVTAWLVLTIYAVESHKFERLPMRWPLALGGALALIVGVVFPGQVLQSAASGLLALHAALGMASYGLLAAATVHAWLMTRAERAMREPQPMPAPDHELPLLTLERLMMALVMAAFVLLSATLLAGVWFGEALYGSAKAWVWNHKTVFSLLAWLVLAGLVAGRWLSGWRGRKAAHWVYGAALLLLLAYVGSRFVFEVFLHRFPLG